MRRNCARIVQVHQLRKAKREQAKGMEISLTRPKQYLYFGVVVGEAGCIVQLEDECRAVPRFKIFTREAHGSQ